LRELRPAAVVLDLEMPEVDGWEFLSCYEELTDGRLPILVLSANLTSRDLKRLGAFGVHTWSNKPFDLDALLDEVRQMVVATFESSPTRPRIGDKQRWAHLRQLTARVVRQLDSSHARLIQAEDTLGWSQARIQEYYSSLGVLPREQAGIDMPDMGWDRPSDATRTNVDDQAVPPSAPGLGRGLDGPHT
jgi:DNA-binding response OmpR family regulator